MTARVRFGIAAAAILAGLYSVGILWRPIPNIVPAAVFLCATVALLRGNAWGGYGGALFLSSITAGLVWTELRVRGPISTPGNLTLIAGFAALFAVLLFLAGRALAAQHAPRSGVLWKLLAIAALAFTTTHNPYSVPTAAMENTIRAGDTLYLRLTGRGYSPSRGDIVAFRYPPDPNQTFVKRVVAIPGDRIRLRDRKVILNGVALNEPYAQHRTEYTDIFRDNFPSEPNVRLIGNWTQELTAHLSGPDLVVPPDKYFVLGDNRDDSLDSRYWGFIDRGAILGTPTFIGFSVNASTEELSQPQQLTTPLLLTPSRIRWSRLLHPVR